ncbi:MAG TPA: hypothetical protein VNA25_26885 [Phycisphaerae bacterium]|nr:hypothetical protein [Phycisphaerae bacterium]
MAQILVRNLDERVARRLKARARRARRSLQAEVKLILEQAAEEPKLYGEELVKRLDAFAARLKGRKLSDSLELIREDRER